MLKVPKSMTREIFWKQCGPGSVVTIQCDGKQWPAEVVSHSIQRLVLKNRRNGAQLRINTKLYAFDQATTRSIRLLRANGDLITVMTPATNWDKVLAAYQEEKRARVLSKRREQTLMPKQTASIMLSQDQIKAAKSLGDGNFSLGVRRAIAAATGVDAKEIRSTRTRVKKNRPKRQTPAKS